MELLNNYYHFIFQRIEGREVYFVNGEHAEFDHIVLCTGYTIDLPFLAEDLRNVILDEEHNDIKVNSHTY